MSVDLHLLERARSSDADLRQKAAVEVVSLPVPERLPLMFEMLGDRDWRVRKTIVDGLLKDESDKTIRGLIASLHDAENAGKRNSATEALVRIGASAIPFVLFALDGEPDLDVRLSLVNILGDLRSDESFETLIASLKREVDVNMVSAIVASLGKYRRTVAVAPLLEALAADDLWLKFHVIEALGEIGDRSALPMILSLYGEKALRKPILEALGRIGDVASVGFLLKVIAEDERLNLQALRALMQIADADRPRIIATNEGMLIRRKFREAFPAGKIQAMIDQVYTTPKREVKNFLLKFLAWSGDERAPAVLLSCIEEMESAEVVVQGLVEFGGAAIDATLERLRMTEEDEVITLLLRVVSEVGGVEAIPTIVGLLDHRNPLIRRLTVETMGRIAEASTIDYILARLDDPDSACQQTAVDAVVMIADRHPGSKTEVLSRVRRLLSSRATPVRVNALAIFVAIQGERFHDELLLASKDDDPLIRQRAISLMGRVMDEQFADQMLLSLTDEAPGVRLAAIHAIVHMRPERGIEPLVGSLEDQDVWIRTAAAQAIGEYRDRLTVPALARHLESDVPPVRIAAIEAIGKSGDPAVASLLLPRLDSTDPEIRRATILALGQVEGAEVLGRLTDALTEGDWRLRAAAATSLGTRADPVVIPALHTVLENEKDPYVRRSIVAAIGVIGDSSSFPRLLDALDDPEVRDDVVDLLLKRPDVFRESLEEAWRTADSRRESLLAAILHAMREGV